jgi:hypothetical protein
MAVKNKFNQPGEYKSQVVVLQFGLILPALWFAIASDKHLSADGVNYFTIILETQAFTFIDWSRQFANYLSQLLLVLAVNSGIVDIPTLRILFGTSLLVPWLLAFGLSLFALRNEDKSAMLFMMISMVSVNLTSDYILSGEHHVMALLSWPILFLLLRRAALQWYDAVLLWGLLILFSRLYPTALILAALFLLIGSHRAAYAESYRQRTIFLGAILISAVVICIAAYYMLEPRSSSNRASFSAAIIKAILSPHSATSAAFTALFFVGWLFRRRVLVLAAVLPLVCFAAYVVWTGDSLTAGQSFGHRTLSISLLPILILLAVSVHWKERRADSTTASVSTVFVAVMVIANIYTTLQWAQFRDQMRFLLAENEGMVPIETTVLERSSQRWRWNNEQLSVVWSDGCVRSVILNEEDGRWQPKGPPEAFRLREYSCYTSEFLRYDPSLCLCGR